MEESPNKKLKTPRQRAAWEWRVKFAVRYEQARKAADITFDEIAKALGVSKGLTNHWAKALAEPPPHDLVNLSDLLRVDPAWLLAGRGPVRHVPPLELATFTWTFGDRLSTNIIDRAVDGLEPGDKVTFDKRQTSVPGDVVLVVFASPPEALIRRVLPHPGSTFQLLADDRTEPRIVRPDDQIRWRGTMVERTRYGSR